MRSGGAGIPAFYTPAGVGTSLEHGGFPIKYAPNGKDVEITQEAKETKEFNGKKYLLEDTIVGDFALIRAWRADENGNI